MKRTRRGQEAVIKVRPISIRWSEWTTRYGELHPRIIDAAHAARLNGVKAEVRATLEAVTEAVTAWERETDAWIAALSPEQRHDLVSLLDAAMMSLFLYLHPDGWPRQESDCGPFRDAWFETIPLAHALQRLGVTDRYVDELRRYEAEAEEIGWLP